MNPNYPIYIVSKGRWESRQTSKALEKMGVPYYIVVEEDEYDNYSSVIDESKVLVLDKRYQDEYDTFDDLGNKKSKGPGPARNFAWEHSIKNGFGWHWVMDDNIPAFGRICQNLYVHVTSGTIFRCAEDFCNRYKNVYMAGFNYDFLAKTKTVIPPYVVNTRIYSCNLIRNIIPFRWRGRYNEDTDLSLNILKSDNCTVQFNAFIQEKATTQTVKGGNTEAFYDNEGTKPKSQMLADMHPDCAKVVWKFNRWHHQVSYKQFKKNKLILKEGLIIPEGINEYGMKLITINREMGHGRV